MHADFDKKLIGGKAQRWLTEGKCCLIAANSSRQSSNGLVEQTWQSIVRMARAYVTEKQVGREFWFYAVLHASRMINQIPGRLGRKLTSPFELVHGVKPDCTTWFELFSVGFFKHTVKRSEGMNTKIQEMSLDGIAVGRDAQTNTILFYNPLTKSYYRPQAWTLDETRLPISHWPSHIKYDGSLHCGRYHHRTDPLPEPFPPGTRVVLSRNGKDMKGTVSNIPILSHPLLHTAASPAPSEDTPADVDSKYVIQLDDGTTTECDFSELAPPEQTQLTSPSPMAPDPQSSLPTWLRHDCKVTMDARGAFHKGYIEYSKEGGFKFVVRKNPRSRKIDWSEDLPDFPQHWATMVGEDILLPGHGTISSFLKPNSSNNAPSANFVSAKNLLNPCPPSLVKALHPARLVHGGERGVRVTGCF
jgi:hypothetical protein